jgi:phage portal protein BeeE
MDTTTLYKTVGDAIGSSLLTPNEGRFKINYEPVEGGDSPMIQQQNYSLAALAKRDAREDPFATAKPEPPKQLPSPDPSLSQDEMEILFESEWRKELVA